MGQSRLERLKLERLKRRADFRAAATGTRVLGSAFILRARRRADEGGVRVGFTVSRQVGNAVERNRVRRRLREMVRLADAGDNLHVGHDYVLIGRRAALNAPFRELVRELDAALNRIHAIEQERTGGTPKRRLHDARPQASERALPRCKRRRIPPMPEL